MRTEIKLAAIVGLLIVGGGIFWSQYSNRNNTNTDNKFKFDPPAKEKDNRVMPASDTKLARDKERTPPSSSGLKPPPANNNNPPTLSRRPEDKPLESTPGSDPAPFRSPTPTDTAGNSGVPALPPKLPDITPNHNTGANPTGSPTIPDAHPTTPPKSPERSPQDPPSTGTPGDQPLTLRPPSAAPSSVTPAVPSNVTPRDKQDKPADSATGPTTTPPKQDETLRPTNTGVTGNRPNTPDNKPNNDAGHRVIPSNGGKNYTIQDGDTLAAIARDEYGNDRYWAAIQAANPDLDPNRLFVGKVIVLPSKETVLGGTGTPAGNAPRKPTDKPNSNPLENGNSARDKNNAGANGNKTAGTPSGGGNNTTGAPASETNTAKTPGTHVVAKNESLIIIARTFLKDETRWREIYELNRDKLSSPDIVPEGTALRLPGPKEKKPAPPEKKTNGKTNGNGTKKETKPGTP